MWELGPLSAERKRERRRENWTTGGLQFIWTYHVNSELFGMSALKVGAGVAVGE
jgi:hypothetical protein